MDKTLQRLTGTGSLRRVDRGLYDIPLFNSLTQKNNPPDPRQVIEAIVRRDQIRVLVDGMTAANDIGLTNAVPAKIVVHTDARLKSISLGQLRITFKPTAASKLYWAGRPAMRIVQALHWLRDTVGQVDDDARLNRRLHTILSDPNDGGIYTTTAQRLGTTPQNVEKDFWVCWTLDALFNGLADRPRLLFKGGTSLSKGFGLIKRFSEDIDVTVFRDDLVQTPSIEKPNALSGKKRGKALGAIKAACTHVL